MKFETQEWHMLHISWQSVLTSCVKLYLLHNYTGWCKKSCYLPLWVKKMPLHSCQMPKRATCRLILNVLFVIRLLRSSLKISSHLTRVNTLLCEIFGTLFHQMALFLHHPLTVVMWTYKSYHECYLLLRPWEVCEILQSVYLYMYLYVCLSARVISKITSKFHQIVSVCCL